MTSNNCSNSHCSITKSRCSREYIKNQRPAVSISACLTSSTAIDGYCSIGFLLKCFANRAELENTAFKHFIDVNWMGKLTVRPNTFNCHALALPLIPNMVPCRIIYIGMHHHVVNRHNGKSLTVIQTTSQSCYLASPSSLVQHFVHPCGSQVGLHVLAMQWRSCIHWHVDVQIWCTDRT